MSVQQFQDAIEDLASNQIDVAGKQLAFQFLVDMSPYPQNSQLLINYGILETLLPFLTLDSDVCTMYASHILANLAIFENNQIIIGQQPIYGKLVNILEKSRNAYLLEKVLMLLTNLSCAESNYEELSRNNVAEFVVNILEFSTEEISHRATLLIQNILHLQSTKEYFIDRQGTKILCKMIQKLNSERIILSTAVIISMLSFDDTKRLIEGGILPILLLQLKSTNLEIHQHALRTITNISADASSRGNLFSSGIAPLIIELLDSTNDEEVLEHAMMTLSNLSLTEQNANQIADIGGIPFIIGVLSTSNNEEILMRVAKLISNLSLYEIPKCMLKDIIPLLEDKASRAANSNLINFCKLAVRRLNVPSKQQVVYSSPSPANNNNNINNINNNINNNNNNGQNIQEDKVEKVVLDREKLSKDHLRRVRIINEIVETEKTYVFQLLSVIQIYIKPLQSMANNGKPLLTENAFREIFSTIELLFKMHSQFLQKLEKSIQSKNYSNTNLPSDLNINNNNNNDNNNNEFEDEVRVGDVFLGLVDCLRMYRNYISNYDKSIDALSLSLENQKFKAFVEAQHAMDPSANPLSALLITPIQRIPRYSLLLQDLIRHMTDDHPDYQNVNNALQGVLAVATYLNQERGKTEAVNKVINIQEQFTNLPLKLVEPHRTFIKEGDLISENLKSKNLQYHRFFLFTDILVEAKQKGEKFRHKNIFYLEFTKIISLPNSKSFRIITQDNGFTFSTDSPADKDNWLQVIGAAITDFKRNSMQRKVASMQLIKNNSQAQLQIIQPSSPSPSPSQ